MTFILLRSYFDYRGYSFRFDNEFFYVTRGYFTKNEMGIVYHQIQHVTVRRGILDRAVGVAHLIIVMNQARAVRLILTSCFLPWTKLRRD